MSIKVSVYDFFAYTIPGGVILFAAVYALSIFGVIQVDFLTLSPSAGQSAVIIGAAYVIGLLFEPIGKAWYRLFKPKNYPDIVLQHFKKTHPHLKVNFVASDWNILLAHIRRENPDIASEIERVNASCIMLRNISLGLVVLVIVEIVKLFIAFSVLDVVIIAILIIFSIIAGKESVKFAQWFYLGIFENIASHSLKVVELTSTITEVNVPEIKTKES